MQKKAEGSEKYLAVGPCTLMPGVICPELSGKLFLPHPHSSVYFVFRGPLCGPECGGGGPDGPTPPFQLPAPPLTHPQVSSRQEDSLQLFSVGSFRYLAIAWLMRTDGAPAESLQAGPGRKNVEL